MSTPQDIALVEALRASLDPHERLPGEWTCEAVGESYHQSALEQSILGRPRDVRRDVRVTAELIRERDNHHDPEAIRVEITGARSAISRGRSRNTTGPH